VINQHSVSLAFLCWAETQVVGNVVACSLEWLKSLLEAGTESGELLLITLPRVSPSCSGGLTE
jgi:hypothetical protein